MRMKKYTIQILILLLGTGLLSPAPTMAQETEFRQVNVGYFSRWPTPSQFSRIKKTYDSVMDARVNWVAFDSGAQMVDAIDAGDIQIAYSLGLEPFVLGLGREIDLTMIGIAVSYSRVDHCVVRGDAEVNEAAGRQTVAVRSGGVTQFKVLEILSRLGVDSSRVDFQSTHDGDDVIAALRNGDAAVACAYGATLDQLRPLGRPLLDDDVPATAALPLFDAIAVSTEFMRRQPELIQAFMDVTEATNAQWRQNPDPMRAAIARAADMNPISVADAMAGFSFPTAAEQKSDAWLGNAVASHTKALADTYVEQGSLPVAMESYAPFMSTRFLR
jgi:taurine transport system substrate-binding protein